MRLQAGITTPASKRLGHSECTMKLSDSLLNLVLPFLKKEFSPKTTITSFHEISGGCVSPGGALITSEGSLFVKWNASRKYPNMFAAEAAGLNLIASTNTIKVPQVIGTLEDDVHQIIIMELINNDAPSKNFWTQFGTQLAHLHTTHHEHFGLTDHNYIGSLEQWNDPNENWIDFFIENRLKVQLKLAVRAGLDADVTKKFEILFQKLPQLLSVEKPSLLHGDLWRGNLITSQGGPCLVDPAAYYGHREVDLAMTQLFGGFSQGFLQSYEEIFALETGWRDRLDLYNLYPLLVHFNLFGHNYLSPISSILKRFV